MSEVVKLKNVEIAFKKQVLLSNINLTINSGDIVQIVGANGSGKSSLLKVIAGLLHPRQGQIYIDEKLLHPGNYAENTAVLINTPHFIKSLSGMDNLLALAQIKNKIGQKEVTDWMKVFGIDPQSRLKVRNYSLGMNQKLGLVQAFMEKEKLILLDEPLNGLDRKSRNNVVQVISQIHQKEPDITIILVSHDKSFAGIVNRIFEIDDGSIYERAHINEVVL